MKLRENRYYVPDNVKTGRNSREREVVNILDLGHRGTIDCQVREGCRVEGVIAIPIHGEDGRMTTEPVAADRTVRQENL